MGEQQNVSGTSAGVNPREIPSREREVARDPAEAESGAQGSARTSSGRTSEQGGDDILTERAVPGRTAGTPPAEEDRWWEEQTYSAREVANLVLRLPQAAQLGVLRFVAPEIVGRLQGEQREGYLRDLLHAIGADERPEGGRKTLH